jgi:hypothetical protein
MQLACLANPSIWEMTAEKFSQKSVKMRKFTMLLRNCTFIFIVITLLNQNVLKHVQIRIATYSSHMKKKVPHTSMLQEK